MGVAAGLHARVRTYGVAEGLEARFRTYGMAASLDARVRTYGAATSLDTIDKIFMSRKQCSRSRFDLYDRVILLSTKKQHNSKSYCI